MVKLREHLLPRLLRILHQDSAEPSGAGVDTEIWEGTASDFVLIENDRLYEHKLVQLNFTTYDVRRGTDIIHTGTSRRDIMLLADNPGAKMGNLHPFLYARVIGVYHANVIYIGPDWHHCGAHRLDFLWVRWFEVVASTPGDSLHSALEAVHFPPMAGTESFGFVDPKDVLRGCHMLPAFAKGLRHPSGAGISRCAKDNQDYNLYYVGR